MLGDVAPGDKGGAATAAGAAPGSVECGGGACSCFITADVARSMRNIGPVLLMSGLIFGVGD